MNRIQIAVGATLLLASAASFAAPTHAPNNPVPAGSTLLVGGATAQDTTVFETLLSSVCKNSAVQADTMDVYFSGAEVVPNAGNTALASAPADFTVVCRQASTQATNTEVVIGKFSGGSETGIAPVASKNPNAIAGAPTQFADYTAACQNNLTARTLTIDGTLYNYRSAGNCGKVTPAAGTPFDASNPRFGVSDVEARLFGISTTGLATANEAAAAVPFAPVVSRNFYEALQTAQNVPAGCTSNFAETNPACVPSLTKAQVRALYSQGVQNITDFRVGGVALTAPGGGAGIRICRRGDTSGTQKAYEIEYFGQGCTTNLGAVFAKDTTVFDVADGTRRCSDVGCSWNTANVGTTRIFQGTGSGQVEDCLDDADNTSIYAIGTLSMDRVPNDGTDEWRYIRVDGVLPGLQSVVDGKWSFFSENTMQTASGLVGQQTSLVAEIKTGLRNPLLLARTGRNISAGMLGGLLVRPTISNQPGNPPVNPVTRPVNTQLKGTSFTTATINNCAPATFTNGVDSPIG